MTNMAGSDNRLLLLNFYQRPAAAVEILFGGYYIQP
jgi:hypothetical protein